MICIHKVDLPVYNTIHMELIALLLIVYFLIGAGICLLVCVNPNDPGMLGTLNRFAFRKFPTIFRYIDAHQATSSERYSDRVC